MFRFFRHIRQNLFLEGRVSRYLGYAVGEITLIVVGILLAVQISVWNQAVEDREEETYYLRQLLTEMKGAQEELEGDNLEENKDYLNFMVSNISLFNYLRFNIHICSCNSNFAYKF